MGVVWVGGLMMMVPWDVTVAVSFRPLRCRYPVKLRTELVGGWLSPRWYCYCHAYFTVWYNTEDRIRTHSRYRVAYQEQLSRNNHYGVWSRAGINCQQWRIHSPPDRVFIRLQLTMSTKQGKINKHGWQEWPKWMKGFNDLHLGWRRWLFAFFFYIYSVLSVLCRSRGRESTGNGENPPEFDLILVRIRIIGRARSCSWSLIS